LLLKLVHGHVFMGKKIRGGKNDRIMLYAFESKDTLYPAGIQLDWLCRNDKKHILNSLRLTA
jgi:hypothetical protein